MAGHGWLERMAGHGGDDDTMVTAAGCWWTGRRVEWTAHDHSRLGGKSVFCSHTRCPSRLPLPAAAIPPLHPRLPFHHNACLGGRFVPAHCAHA